MMPKHHKGRATTTEGLKVRLRSQVPSSGGRQRRSPMLQHRLRDASYPELGTCDPIGHLFLFHHTSSRKVLDLVGSVLEAAEELRHGGEIIVAEHRHQGRHGRGIIPRFGFKILHCLV